MSLISLYVLVLLLCIVQTRNSINETYFKKMFYIKKCMKIDK